MCRFLRRRVPACLVPFLYRGLLTGFLTAMVLPLATAAPPDTAARWAAWKQALQTSAYRYDDQPTFEAKRDASLAAIADVRRFVTDSPNGLAWQHFLMLGEAEQALRQLQWQVPPEPAPEAQPPKPEGDDFDFENAPFDDEVAEVEDAPPVPDQADQATAADPIEQLRDALGRLIGKHPGLEREPLRKLRRALQETILAARLLQDAELQTTFTRLRARLVDAFALAEQDASAIDVDWYRDVLPAVSWLDEFGQAEPLVDEMKSAWSRPNLRVKISAGGLEVMTRRIVSEVEPIREVSDGRRITGNATATGTASMKPIGNRNGKAECRVVFSGTIVSTLNGSQGPVSFGLLGNTNLNVSQPIHFAEPAFTVLAPTAASGTNLCTRCIGTRHNGLGSNLIRKIAAKKIDEERPAARRDLDRQSVQRFMEAFSEDVHAEIAEAETAFRDEVLAPMLRADIKPEQLLFLTDDHALQIAMTLDGGFGFGAPMEPHQVLGPTSHAVGSAPDLQFRIHETTINRLAQRYLAGERIENFSAMAEQAEIELPTDQALPEDIAIEFAGLAPVSAKFQDGILELTIRGDRYEVAGANLAAMKTRIRYRPSIVDGKLKMTLVEPAEVLPPDSGPGAKFIMQQNILVRRLQEDLPRERTIDPPELPEPADRLGRLAFQRVVADGGWLVVELRGNRQRVHSPAMAAR